MSSFPKLEPSGSENRFLVQDIVLDRQRKLVDIAMRTPASVGEPLNAAFLVAIEDQRRFAEGIA